MAEPVLDADTGFIDEQEEADELKRYAVIEIPGFLKSPADPHNAILAMGGEREVRANNELRLNKNQYPLLLNLRPGVVNSSSSITGQQNDSPSNLFLLELSEVVCEENPTGLNARNTEAFGLAEKQSATVRTVAILSGRIASITKFSSLSDFQYHTGYAERQGATSTMRDESPHCGAFAHSSNLRGASELERVSESESLLEALTQYRDKGPHEDMNLNIDRLRPARFSRNKFERGAFDYWFRQYGASTEAGIIGHISAKSVCRIGEDRRLDANRLKSLDYRISADADKVPNCAIPDDEPPVVRGRQAYDSLFSIITRLFKERPIWLRRALYEGVPAELRNNFKRVLRAIAYCFDGPGPFYQAWIRYGYDPRKDPAARKYQVTEVRCSDPILKEAALKQKKTQPETWELIGDSFKLFSRYTLAQVPQTAVNFVQLCDIKLEPVAELCQKTEFHEPFDKKYGFFTEEKYNELVLTIRAALNNKAVQILGQDRVLELDRTRQAFKDSLQKKRRRRDRLKQFAHPNRRAQHSKMFSSVDTANAEREEVISNLENKARVDRPATCEKYCKDKGADVASDPSMKVDPAGKPDCLVGEHSPPVEGKSPLCTSGPNLDSEEVEAYHIFGDEEGNEDDSMDEGDEESDV